MRLERIDSLFDFEKGTLQSTKCEPGDFDFITASRDWKTHATFTHEKEALVIAVAASGSLGRTHYVNGKFIASDLCFILTPKGEYAESISLPFYYFVFNGLKEAIVKQCATGTAKQAINQQNFANYRIPYFEPDEQDRMALRLRASFASQESLEHEITHQETLLAKLKQGILQEAIQGKLTADWRAANPDVEPASQLLHRIQAEKARLIAAKKLRPEKPLLNISPDEIPFEIPKGWEWCRYGGLCEYVTSGSRGWQQFYSDSGALFIRAQNIKTDKLLLDDEAFVDLPNKAEGTRARVLRNDILITITGGNLAKTAVVEDDFEEAYVSQHIALTRLVDTGLATWIHMALITDKGPRGTLLGYSRGDKPGLNLPNIRSVPIPLPPLAEQAAIVERVEALMTTCWALEAEIEHARTHAAHLLQAVLKEAFAPAAKVTA
jgi:type I restriction enzyme S subunit